MPGLPDNRDLRFSQMRTANGTQRLGLPPTGKPNLRTNFSTANHIHNTKRTASIDARTENTT
jgi:hypothetical protein